MQCDKRKIVASLVQTVENTITMVNNKVETKLDLICDLYFLFLIFNSWNASYATTLLRWRMESIIS